MLKDKLQEDLKQAMLARNELKKSVLRLLVSAISYLETQKDAGYKANDEEVLETISREIKKRKESVEAYKNGNRPELAEKEESEAKILQEYLPEQMSEEEIRSIIEKGIKETGAKIMSDMGKVMQAIMPKLKGKADGNLISQIVKDKLT